METRTRIVLLMHPMEWKDERCTTGRLACLNLANSEILQGIGFDENPRVRELIDDPANFPALLYPGKDSIDLAGAGFESSGLRPALEAKRLVVFLVDSTWACSKAILRASPGLLTLPRLMFTPREKSRWYIKRQPNPICLSTLETIHELLLSLEEAGLDAYPDKERLLDVFMRMQAYQAARKAADSRPRYLGCGRDGSRRELDEGADMKG